MSDTLLKQAVLDAVQAAATSAANSLEPKDVVPVTKDIIASMPNPIALQDLTPQIARSLLVAAGGILVSKGYLQDSDLQSIVGAALVIGPILWRIGTTLYARIKAPTTTLAS